MAMHWNFFFLLYIVFNVLVVDVYNHATMRIPKTRPAVHGVDDAVANATPLGNEVEILGARLDGKSMYKYFPCGSSETSPISRYSPGETINVVLFSTNNHGGGDCQFALSYKNDSAYVVFHYIYKTCLKDVGREVTYPVTLPENIPGGAAIFCMAWIPANVFEYYHSCADIIISGKREGVITGKMLVVVNVHTKGDLKAKSGGENGDLVYTAPSLTVRVDGDSVIVTPPALAKSDILKEDDPLLQLFKRTGTSTNSNGAEYVSNIQGQSSQPGQYLSLGGSDALPLGSTAEWGKLVTGKTTAPKPPSNQTPSAGVRSTPLVGVAGTPAAGLTSPPPAYEAPASPKAPLASSPVNPPGYDSVPPASEPPKPNSSSEYLAFETPAEGPSAPTPDQLSLSAASPFPSAAPPAKDVDNGYPMPPTASEPSDALNSPAPPKEDKAVPACDLKTTSVETVEPNVSQQRNPNVARYLASLLASIAGLSYFF